MEDSRKLKRGLEDISPLFQKMIQKKAVPQEKGTGVQCFGVFSPESSEDSLLFSTLIASQLSAKNYAASVISVQNEPVEPQRSSNQLQHVRLAWNEFRRIWDRQGSEIHAHKPENRLIFLDAEIMGSYFGHKVNSVIDKWILMVQPSMESISECYKMMKSTLALNSQLEFFMLFDGLPEDSRGTLIFEKLSEMTSAHLGINLVWLGCLHFSGQKEPISSELAFEHLLLQPLKTNTSIDKKRMVELFLPSLDPMEV